MKQTEEIQQIITEKMQTLLKIKECEDIGEIWKDIPDYDGKYKASSLGRIKSIARLETFNYDNRYDITRRRNEKILKARLNNTGYLYLCLRHKGISNTLMVHRIIAETFLPKILDKNIVNHKNCIKTDNKVDNLEWCSYRENYEHAVFNGCRSDGKGENNFGCKLTKKQVKNIRYLYLNTNITCIELSKKYNVFLSTIYKIIKGTIWSDDSIKTELYQHKLKNKQQKERFRAAQTKRYIIKNSKLNFEKVTEIRKLYNCKNYSCYSLGKIFGVSHSTIWLIVTNKTWNNIVKN